MNSTTKTIFGISTLTAPLGFVLGWAILIQRTEQAPDMGWTLSHLFLLAGVVLFVPTIAGLRYMLDKKDVKTADIGMGLAILGILALVGQFAIDLAVGQLATSPSEMSSIFKNVYSAPPIILSFQITAIMFYVGLIMLILLLIRFHLVAQWAGILAMIGIIIVVGGAFSGTAIATLLGFVSLWAGLVPIGWRILTQPSSNQL